MTECHFPVFLHCTIRQFLFDQAYTQYVNAAWRLSLPLPQMGRCVCGRTAINQWELRERRGHIFRPHKYSVVHSAARSLTTGEVHPGRPPTPFEFLTNTPPKNCNHEQEILRWWKLEDERRQEEPRRTHPHHERSQGGLSCWYVVVIDSLLANS